MNVLPLNWEYQFWKDSLYIEMGPCMFICKW